MRELGLAGRGDVAATLDVATFTVAPWRHPPHSFTTGLPARGECGGGRGRGAGVLNDPGPLPSAGGAAPCGGSVLATVVGVGRATVVGRVRCPRLPRVEPTHCLGAVAAAASRGPRASSYRSRVVMVTHDM